jgi:hypothetical protein
LISFAFYSPPLPSVVPLKKAKGPVLAESVKPVPELSTVSRPALRTLRARNEGTAVEPGGVDSVAGSTCRIAYVPDPLDDGPPVSAPGIRR